MDAAREYLYTGRPGSGPAFEVKQIQFDYELQKTYILYGTC